VFVATGWALFPSAGADDAFITFGAVDRFVEEGRLVNYNGEWIEQSSSLLQVVVLAALRAVTPFETVTLGWIFAIGCGVATVIAAYPLAIRLETPMPALAPLLAGLSGSLVYWSFSGMESSLTALCALLFLIALAGLLRRNDPRDRIAFGCATVLYLTCRPESTIVALCVMAALWLWSAIRKDRARITGALWVVVAASCAVAAVRFWLFGSVFPQSVYAKNTTLSIETVPEGLAFLARFVGWWPLYAAAAVGAWRVVSGRASPIFAATWLFVAAYLAFGTLVRDWMEDVRFLVPCAAPAAVLLLHVVGDRRTRWLPALVAGAASIVMIYGTLELARRQSKGIPVWAEPVSVYQPSYDSAPAYERMNRTHIRDMPVSAHLNDVITRLLADDPTTKLWILTGQGGMVVYHAMQHFHGRVGVIDRRGLMDRILSSSPTLLRAGSDRLGLVRSYAYLFDHYDPISAETELPRPDIVFDGLFSKQDRKAIVGAGYVAIYHQRGWVTHDDRWFPGWTLWGEQTIFVRKELAAKLGADFPASFRFVVR